MVVRKSKQRRSRSSKRRHSRTKRVSKRKSKRVSKRKLRKRVSKRRSNKKIKRRTKKRSNKKQKGGQAGIVLTPEEKQEVYAQNLENASDTDRHMAVTGNMMAAAAPDTNTGDIPPVPPLNL